MHFSPHQVGATGGCWDGGDKKWVSKLTIIILAKTCGISKSWKQKNKKSSKGAGDASSVAAVAAKISRGAIKCYHPIPLLRLAMISLMNPKSTFNRATTIDKKCI